MIKHTAIWILVALSNISLFAQAKPNKFNLLFIISDDLCSNALSCYGSTICKTPNIDKLAKQGVLFKQAYCQATYCGPSRASFMSGYYPHATNVLNYKSGRKAIGDRATWAEHFKNEGYHTARVSKIFHMPVPKGIERGDDGEDDARSWSERFNSQGPEWKAPGKGETLEGNPNNTKPPIGGNTFVRVEADGDDLVHSDGKTAQKACELIKSYKGKQFFLAVGFARPHVPFVSPKKYYKDYPWKDMPLPERIEDDWDDVPKSGINYKTSLNMKMSIDQQRKAISAYYASVSYMDAQVGKIMDTLKETKQEDSTIVIFTSDHGFHLGEHDFWAKVSLYQESTQIPLIINVPGKKPAISHSIVELLDLFPTTASLCNLPIPSRLQGKDVSPILDNPNHSVRDEAFSVNAKGFLIRNERWAYIEYSDKKGKGGAELFDMKNDPKQFTNLVKNPEYTHILKSMKQNLITKLAEVRSSDLALKP